MGAVQRRSLPYWLLGLLALAGCATDTTCTPRGCERKPLIVARNPDTSTVVVVPPRDTQPLVITPTEPGRITPAVRPIKRKGCPPPVKRVVHRPTVVPRVAQAAPPEEIIILPPPSAGHRQAWRETKRWPHDQLPASADEEAEREPVNLRWYPEHGLYRLRIEIASMHWESCEGGGPYRVYLGGFYPREPDLTRNPLGELVPGTRRVYEWWLEPVGWRHVYLAVFSADERCLAWGHINRDSPYAQGRQNINYYLPFAPDGFAP